MNSRALPFGLHGWLTEEMGFTYVVASDQYRHAGRNICVSGDAIRVVVADLADAAEMRRGVADLFFAAEVRSGEDG